MSALVCSSRQVSGLRHMHMLAIESGNSSSSTPAEHSIICKTAKACRQQAVAFTDAVIQVVDTRKASLAACLSLQLQDTSPKFAVYAEDSVD